MSLIRARETGEDMNLGLEEFLRVRVGFAPHAKRKYKGHCEEAFPEDRVATCGPIEESNAPYLCPDKRNQSTLPVDQKFFEAGGSGAGQIGQ